MCQTYSKSWGRDLSHDSSMGATQWAGHTCSKFCVPQNWFLAAPVCLFENIIYLHHILMFSKWYVVSRPFSNGSPCARCRGRLFDPQVPEKLSPNLSTYYGMPWCRSGLIRLILIRFWYYPKAILMVLAADMRNGEIQPQVGEKLSPNLPPTYSALWKWWHYHMT